MALNKLKLGTALSTQITEQNDNIVTIESHLAESAKKHIHSSGSSWIRYDDGTQEIFMNVVLTRESSTALSTVCVFPKPFANTEYVITMLPKAGLPDGVRDSFMYVLNAKTTDIKLLIARNYSASSGFEAETTVPVMVQAIGKWK